MRLLFGFIALIFLCFTSACSVNPVTGKNELSLMSTSQEIAMGQQNYGAYQQQQGGRYTVDPNLSAYVNRIGHKLAQYSGNSELPYEFVVLNSSEFNAWALPGGKIAINRGLLDILDDESQLAAVLAHEIVHAAARHTARQQTQAALMQVGLVAATVASQKTDYGQLLSVGAGLGANAWQAHYGRDQELEADEYGVAYMIKAGYDPLGAVELQQKFVALSQSKDKGFMANLFASHPPSEQRVARNERLANGHTGGRNKVAFEQALKTLKRDRPAYEQHTKALLAAQNKDFDAALSFTNKAISFQPKEPSFFITKGQLLLSKEEHTPALAAFKKAVQLNPQYYLGHLGMGLISKKQNQTKVAVQALEASMALLPTPIASYYLGEYALDLGDSQKARAYFEFASQGGGEIAEAAQAQLQKLAPLPVAQ